MVASPVSEEARWQKQFYRFVNIPLRCLAHSETRGPQGGCLLFTSELALTEALPAKRAHREEHHYCGVIALGRAVVIVSKHLRYFSIAAPKQHLTPLGRNRDKYAEYEEVVVSRPDITREFLILRRLSMSLSCVDMKEDRSLLSSDSIGA